LKFNKKKIELEEAKLVAFKGTSNSIIPLEEACMNINSMLCFSIWMCCCF